MDEKNTVPRPSRRAAFGLTNRVSDPFDLYDHLPYRIAIVSNLLLLSRDAKIRQVCSLGPREMRVLLNIGSYMPIKAADIAYQSRLDSYTVSRAVKVLNEQGMLDSDNDPTNRRVKLLSLNDQGLATYRKLTAVMARRAGELEAALSANERNTLFKLLRKVEDKAESILVQQALDKLAADGELSAEERELVRWHKRSSHLD